MADQEKPLRGVDPAKGGPYIQVAAFCEKVLQEGDGVLSLIRIVDTITQEVEIKGTPPPETLKEAPPLRYRLKLVLMLKAGKARGPHQVKITPILPTGETKTPFIGTLHFEGEEKGANLILDFAFEFPFEGLYWFEVCLNEHLLTQLPLRVRRSISVLP